MNEILTFANFSLADNSKEDIYKIGAVEGGEGVIPQMAKVFGYELTPTPDGDNLDGLRKASGPAKELLQNVDLVQAALGRGDDAVAVARGWQVKAGTLSPVERYYGSLEEIAPDTVVDVAVETGGVRNWMHRRMVKFAQFSGKFSVEQALLVGGNRPMKTGEGKDVIEGMVEADYLEDIVEPQLGNIGLDTETLRVESGEGDTVMAAAADRIAEVIDLNNPSCKIAVISNGGIWPHNAGQLRRALRAINPHFDQAYKNLIVAADGFRYGTGQESTFTHQNPFSGTGQIPRNAEELARQYE